MAPLVVLTLAHNLQNVLCNLAGVRIRVWVSVMVSLKVRARFRSKICKLCIRNCAALLQIAEIDKLCVT